MNKVILVGRCTKDVVVKYGNENKPVARFNLAVDRQYKREGEQSADFISCVAFNNRAEFLDKYGKKGTKFIVEGHIQTGSYQNNEGKTVYTTDVIVENIEFAESKSSNSGAGTTTTEPGISGFAPIEEDELPFQ